MLGIGPRSSYISFITVAVVNDEMFSNEAALAGAACSQRWSEALKQIRVMPWPKQMAGPA